MGEVAEMMLDGTLCEGCGDFLNENPPGHPCYCSGCSGEDEDSDTLYDAYSHLIRAEDYMCQSIDDDNPDPILKNILTLLQSALNQLDPLINFDEE